MDRRQALAALGTLGLTAANRTLLAQQGPVQTNVDKQFLRMYDNAQRRRPTNNPSRVRLAPAAEPGTPLQVSAQLVGARGQLLPGVTIFGYQTDHTGLYHFDDARGWRLQAWATTDADARVTFDTIRPAPYPERNAAAHIHFYAEGPGVPRQEVQTLLFEGDPLISAKERAKSDALGRYGFIRPVRINSGRQECDIVLRAAGEYVF